MCSVIIADQSREQVPRGDSPIQSWGAVPNFGAASFYRESGGYLLRFHGIADFRLSDDGASLTCHPVLDGHASWEPIYLQQVIPLQRAQQGQAVFHGGAVGRYGHAVALVGPSGQGKSTLTAACAANGLAFLTDDCLVLREDDGIRVDPDVDHIRVWDDSFEALSGTLPNGQRDWPKPRLHADRERLPHLAETLPLACMIALDVDAEDIVLERLSPSDAAMCWRANAFVVDLRSPQILRSSMQRAARLAEAVPAFRLAYPRDYARLPEVVASVSACLDAVLAEKTA